ncbi:hypothetical protein CN887_28845 [Bacillus pseudomycoides]|nr:hypothetical protein CN887_28845 [Bacillus pseudomycoides]
MSTISGQEKRSEPPQKMRGFSCGNYLFASNNKINISLPFIQLFPFAIYKRKKDEERRPCKKFF